MAASGHDSAVAGPSVAPDRAAGRSGRAVVWFVVLFAIPLGLDLGLKHWAFSVWPAAPVDVAGALEADRPLPGGAEVVAPRVLALKLTLNRGAVFGIGAGYRWFFVLATVGAIAVIGGLFAASRAREWWLHAALALILAGAVGNLVDRVLYGAVRDMLWLFPGVRLPFGWSWPGGARDAYPWIFNAADAFLLCGIGIILVRTLFTADARGAGASDGSSGPRP